MGTNAQTMAWIVDEYRKFHGYSPAVVTGKPVELGGSLGRDAATGRGLLYAAECLFADLGKSVAGPDLRHPGFRQRRLVGGAPLRRRRRQDRRRLRRDRRGAQPRGLDVDALCRARGAHQGRGRFPRRRELPRRASARRAVRCPDPGGARRRAHTAHRRRGARRVILEGANHPTDPEADDDLRERGITVVPDIYANAGGVTVSYFEWVQNIQQFSWDEERVNGELRRTMRASWADLTATAKKLGCDLRTAAFALAIGRVARATALRGI
jgi:glutamate dehydrogenase (NAD(P)+)